MPPVRHRATVFMPKLTPDMIAQMSLQSHARVQAASVPASIQGNSIIFCCSLQVLSHSGIVCSEKSISQLKLKAMEVQCLRELIHTELLRQLSK